MKSKNMGFGVDLRNKVVGVLYMRKDDFINMCKNMVVEYNNRYKRVNGNITSISPEDVEVENYYNTQHVKQAVLSTPFIFAEKFIVTFDQLNKVIDSYVIDLTNNDRLVIKGTGGKKR